MHQRNYICRFAIKAGSSRFTSEVSLRFHSLAKFNKNNDAAISATMISFAYRSRCSIPVQRLATRKGKCLEATDY